MPPVLAAAFAFVAASAAAPAAAAPHSRLLEGFEDATLWTIKSTDQVTGSMRSIPGVEGNALCLDFDFNGVSGYVIARRELPLELPDNYVFELKVRGDAPSNKLEFKLLDGSGENVWWFTRPEYKPPRDWQTLKIKRRQIEFAWGPTSDRELRRRAAIELAVASGLEGGRGSVCFDELRLQELPVPPNPPPPMLSASSSLSQYPPADALDGKPGTAWRSDSRSGAQQELRIDFGQPREFGGLVLHWQEGMQATRYEVQLSDDAVDWTTVRQVSDGRRRDQPLLLPESEARYVRLRLQGGASDAYGLAEIEVKDLAWGATPNAFFQALAKDAPRGHYPRGFSEQPYWTVVGVDGGGANSALMSEDGAVEIGKGGFSIEPFLVTAGGAVSWADVRSTHSLQDGYLPIPSVHWHHREWRLDITSFAGGSKERSRLLTSYTVTNLTGRSQSLTLALAVRPFQVNPHTQSLNTLGGVHPIHALAWDGRSVSVDDRSRVVPLQRPDAFVASRFDAGSLIEQLGAGQARPASRLHDAFGYASGALLFKLTLPPKGSRTIGVAVALTGADDVAASSDAAGRAWLQRHQKEVAAAWRSKLNRVSLQLPPAGRAIADSTRSALAQMLIARDGPALQPGTRSYARSWIRDGAMMVEGLLRLGHTAAAVEFVRWFAPYQFASGKVPCCVDKRGSDPVPENDSHGELIFSVEQLYRYTGDRAQLASLWPHVEAAARYMETLRQSERTEANRTPARAHLFGLMPPSISHEGYSDKPAYSYWDDFWALRGFRDAVTIARALGHDSDAARWAAWRDEFQRELLASISATAAHHRIDFIAGAADRGDFDATSTTIGLSPGGELGRLPQRLLDATFERYWREFVARRDGQRQWNDYTPYELRVVGSFVRLGQPERAHEALKFFFGDQRPHGWNQWAEVVGRDPRKPRFIGDMPHAWVASDYIRSALDMFAYERESDHSLVLAAGVPREWLTSGVAINGLATSYGALNYRLRREGGIVRLEVGKGLTVPAGGLVLAWPGSGPLPQATIDGRPVQWRGRELHVRRAQVTVRLAER